MNIPSRGMLARCQESGILKAWTGDAFQLAQLEADLCQIKNVKQLAWVPDINEKKGKHTKQALKGVYQVKVLRQSGATYIIGVQTDWVRKKF